MSKPKNPLLSFGARGTIADSLTFQRRGRLTIAESIPIPTDRKSPAQLIWRQIYRNAVAAWHALSPEEKQAWRGVCPGLSPYQCFMKSELKYPIPPPPIYIGADAGAERTFTGLSIAVQAGDYIGCFFDTGTIERDKDGFAGMWYKPNQWIDPGDEASYSLIANDALSLNGIGESTP